ncbi:MAG: hypothetical protein JSU67_05365 [Gammaproteobacteria bacterium]|nr:MAG: hypothetical protein JSU67_05365 [Gammaproteobacteria bacterium]
MPLNLPLLAFKRSICLYANEKMIMDRDKPQQKDSNIRLITDIQQVDHSIRRNNCSLSVPLKYARGILFAVTCGFQLSAGSVNAADDLWDLKTVEDVSRLKISFHSAIAQYRRIGARQSRTRDGWVESGIWEAEDQSGKSQVLIFIASLYHNAFTNKDIRDIRSLAKTFSGSSYLDFGERGTLTSGSGDMDYIFYRASRQSCVFVRKYWSDPELTSDIIQLTSTYGWVAGSNFIYVSYCGTGGADLQLKDMNVLFGGIEAKELYWPENMFGSVGSLYGDNLEKGSESASQVTRLTGTYSAEITGNWRHAFMLDDPSHEVRIVQSGVEVSGTVGSNNVKIWGYVEGNEIIFNWLGPSSRSGTGKWIIEDGGRELKGNWSTGHGIDASGTWNLQKLE